MPKCPNCDAEIDELYYIGMEGHIIATIEDNGELNYEFRELEDDDDDDCYTCPCCNAIVAHDDDEAKQILLGL